MHMDNLCIIINKYFSKIPFIIHTKQLNLKINEQQTSIEL